jgi:hypothetical protein
VWLACETSNPDTFNHKARIGVVETKDVVVIPTIANEIAAKCAAFKSAPEDISALRRATRRLLQTVLGISHQCARRVIRGR